ETFMDVNTAVQLERLEEIERALIELDPNQFVRKEDPNATGAQSDANSGTDSGVSAAESAMSSW
ncbi:MAG: hypothetical protein NTX77_08550, partial [Actinobacteria bacterium]|nr:hypothetical protein [Actinomycetota bacterium]